MRAVLVIATLAAVVAAPTAQAAWGPALRPAGSARTAQTVLAVNGTGTVAATWVSDAGGMTVVRAAVGTAAMCCDGPGIALSRG